MTEDERQRIVQEVFRRLDYADQQSTEASNAICARNDYGEGAVCLEKQAAELMKAAHDCRLLANTPPRPATQGKETP